MNKSWDNRSGPSFTALSPLVNEAKRCKLWLYNKADGNWYTPEEFMDTFSPQKFDHFKMLGFLEDIVIRDPIAGVKAGYKELDNRLLKMQHETSALRAKLEEFAKKALIYYQTNK